MSDIQPPDEHLMEQVAKFRYNWKQFNKIMDEYERAIEMSVKGRQNAKSDLINGFPSNKWEKFIQEKEVASTVKMKEAIDTFQLLKSMLAPEPIVVEVPAPVAKTPPRRRKPVKKRKR